MKPNLSACIKKKYVRDKMHLTFKYHPDTTIFFHEICNFTHLRAQKVQTSLCTCRISIEPSQRMDVDESSDFCHLDRLNIGDGFIPMMKMVIYCLQ